MNLPSSLRFYLPILFALVVFTLASCANRSNSTTKAAGNAASSSDPCSQSLSDFVPQAESHDFYIEAEVNGRLLRYPQVNFEWTNVSNTFFKDYQETWLQAYPDTTMLQNHWEVRIHDIDIEHLSLPYRLGQSDGTVSWYDSRVDQVVENSSECQGVDNGCKFFLSAGGAGNSIVIEKVANQVIEGTFEGTMILTRTGLVRGVDPDKCYRVSNGHFKIKYRKG